jgi:hypothetical protein
VHVCPPLSAGAPALPSFGKDELALVLVIVETTTKVIIVRREDVSSIFFISIYLLFFIPVTIVGHNV